MKKAAKGGTMKVLARTHFGNPILRERSKRVPQTWFKRKTSHQFIKRMFFTMERAQGVGLAAPQVNKSLQLAVLKIEKSNIRPNAIELSKTVVINPSVVKSSKEVINDWEGCLSLEGVRGMVPRHKEITVTYSNEQGEKTKKTFKGLQARVFQHEIDHLNGILFVDRMKDMKTLMTAKEFKKRIVKKGGLKSK